MHRLRVGEAQSENEVALHRLTEYGLDFARPIGIDLELKTEIVDCDLHGPAVAEVLEDECSFEEALVDDWNETVHLLTAGQLKTNPHTLVGAGGLAKLVEEARNHYRYIIIDTPPVLAASESLVIAKIADASLVCAMRDVSRLDQIRMVCQRLQHAHGNPVGVVLNGIPARRYAYDYGSYGYGRYGYHYARTR